MTTDPIPYAAFRTGLTFHDVYHLIYSRKWKRRRGVLGKWREIKKRMYAEYLTQVESQTANESYVPSTAPIPE